MISFEVLSSYVKYLQTTKEEILSNIERLKSQSNDIDLVFKIPFSSAGIEACNAATRNGDKTNMHLQKLMVWTITKRHTVTQLLMKIV